MYASVVIPTMNRGKAIIDLLERLIVQDYPSEDFEIIVADSSRDGTETILQDFIKRHSGKPLLQYLREERVGLHYARHAGAYVAQGEIYVQIEDDAIPEKQWLRSLLAPYVDSRVMATGGRTLPRYESAPPWWVDYFKEYLSMSPFESVRLEFTSGAPIFAVNMSVRMDKLFAVGGYNPCIMGPEWQGDGESGLQYKLFRKFPDSLIIYVPEAVVYHVVPNQRLNLAYFKKRARNQGANDFYSWYHNVLAEGSPNKNYRIVRHLCVLLVGALKSSMKAAFLRKNGPQYYQEIFQVKKHARGLQFGLNLLFNSTFRAFVERTDWLSDPRIRAGYAVPYQ